MNIKAYKKLILRRMFIPEDNFPVNLLLKRRNYYLLQKPLKTKLTRKTLNNLLALNLKLLKK